MKHLFHIERRLRKILMNQAELAEHLQGKDAQLNKALAEINQRIQDLITAVENAGNTTPEVDKAIENLDVVTQALDDIVPDTP
jgi:ABC-type transporter Mla subunit MlaD